MPMNSTEQVHEPWQVEANGQIFDTNFAEMTTWIDEGSLLRIDRVRKGNLRWIEAGKVPALLAVFNAKDNGETITPPVITTTELNPTTLPAGRSANFAPAAPLPSAEPMCSLHEDAPAAYSCDTCANVFCKACPSSYGGTVKICPFCGALCKSLAEVEKARVETFNQASAMSEGFGFSDFANALAYPFRFKTSLILGALMYMFFSLGQSAVGFGGIFMIVGAIFSVMLANTLTFGILANTVENFAQGKVGLNFMPSFEDFSIWDDVVHPFFLSIGVYISSFGPLIAVLLVAVFMLVGAVKTEMNGIQSDAARTTNPGLPYAANAAKQSEQVRELLSKQQEAQKARIAAIEDQFAGIEGGATELEDTYEPNTAADEEAEFQKLNQMIQDSRKAQVESVVGKHPDTVAGERSEMLSQILGYGAVFLLLAGVALLWGLFYFPAACAVAGYTRSFAATLNPAVGIDTIRRLGGTYVKILLMGLAIAVMSGLASGFLEAVLSPFDMPAVGNMPAKAIGSLFGFYFAIVFSCVIGFAIYKAGDRLKLYS